VTHTAGAEAASVGGSPDATQVRLEIADRLATLTLDGPSSRNALSGATGRALLTGLRQIAEDPEVRAVLLTGANGAFTAGADLRELRAGMASGTPHDLSELLRSGLNPLVSTLATLPKPVVAAIPGAAAGAGMSLALACDLRLAGRSAVFSTAFAAMGLTADAGMSWLLPRIVGTARATALLFLPERIPAERALDLGLVQAVLPDEVLLDSATELAHRLADGPTSAYAAIKRSIGFAATASLPEALELEAQLQGQMGRTADHQNAVAAFLNRQTPTFTGR
jgi:2-(1,2-epoxy-1,2-dihydrophenyl)acetyl-CoA isomerase